MSPRHDAPDIADLSQWQLARANETKAKRILIVGSGFLKVIDNLRAQGFIVQRTDVFEDADEFSCPALTATFDGRPPDLVVVDHRRETDSKRLREIRDAMQECYGTDIRIPMIGLVTPSSLRVEDLDTHLDDFVLPPFDVDEIAARITLALRRLRTWQHVAMLQFEDMVIDSATHIAKDGDGNVINLSPRESELLQFLCQNAGRFFGRDRLLSLVWGDWFEGGPRAVDIIICRLRSKLPPRVAERLQTIRGVGYGLSLS